MSDTRFRRLRHILISTTAIAALSAPAFAQETTTTVETVVVTAQKTEQNIQVVPIAITAFTARALEQKGITDVASLSNSAPNVTFDGGVPFGGSTGVLSAYIRGIGQMDFAFNQDPGVGVYLDGVYLARSVGANTDLLDVQRIEVLKGPQGTLFGRNTIGGAISIVTRDPGSEFAYQAEITAGDYNRFDVRGYVDLPLSDNLRTSISFSTKRRDGFLERVPFPTGMSDPRWLAAANAGGLFAPGDAFFPGSPQGDCVGAVSCPTIVDSIHAGVMTDYETHDVEGGESQWNLRGKAVWQTSESWKFTLALDYSNIDEPGQATRPFVINPDYPGGLGGLANACLLPIADFLPNGPVICGPRGAPGSTYALDAAAYANLVPGQWYKANFDGDPNNNRLPYGPWFVHPDKDRSYSTGPSFSRIKQWGAAFTVDWDVSDNMHVKSISAHRAMSFQAGLDGDGSPLNIHEVSFKEGQRQWSQELQVTGQAFNDSVDYVLGVFYFNEFGNIHDYVTFPALFLQVDGNNLLDTTAWAGFFHFDWHITDQLSVIIGGRYTEEDKDFQGFQHDLNAFVYKISGCWHIDGFGGLPTVDPITDLCRQQLGFPDPNDPTRFFPPGVQNLKFDNFSPNLGLRYQIDEDAMVYATYSEGFKTGNWTTRLSNPHPVYNDSLHFDPEFAKSYEAGFKADFAGGRMRLNGAAFYSKYDGIQLNFQVGISPTLQNAGDARIWGGELEFTGVFNDNFTLAASVGYLNAKYESITPGAGSNGVLLTVNEELPKTPEWKININPQFTWPMGDSGSLMFMLDYTYTSEIFNDVQNTPELARDPTHMLNASMTYEAPSGNWEVVVGGTNLTDERFIVTGVNQGGIQIIYGSYNRPREWFATLRIRS